MTTDTLELAPSPVAAPKIGFVSLGCPKVNRSGFWDGKPVKTRMLDLCEQLAQLAEPFGAWVRLHF